LYNTWFDSLRTLQTGAEPLKIMHFSFVAPRNAQFGSWGMLETMDQDVSVVPAPKYTAILENMAAPECDMTLAVEWNDYAVAAAGCGAVINWSTAAEENNDYFELFRSRSGSTFELLDRVAGSGTTSQGTDYAYTDKGLTDGRYIYRIDQVDYDGQRSSVGLRTVDVKCAADGTGLVVFPNPATQSVSFSGTVPYGANVGVYAADGRLVQSANFARLDGATLEVAGLPAGIYQLKIHVSGTGETLLRRMVKR